MCKSLKPGYANEIVCPHCKYEFSESWEIRMNEHGSIGKLECRGCGRKFEAYRNIEISYITEK